MLYLAIGHAEYCDHKNQFDRKYMSSALEITGMKCSAGVSFRPHLMHSIVCTDAAYCCRRSGVVCVSAYLCW